MPVRPSVDRLITAIALYHHPYVVHADRACDVPAGNSGLREWNIAPERAPNAQLAAAAAC